MTIIPVSMVMLKIENRCIANAGRGSEREKEAKEDFPEISNSGTNVEFGSTKESIVSRLLPIKNKWYKNEIYQIVRVGREKPKYNIKGSNTRTLLINTEGKLPKVVPR